MLQRIKDLFSSRPEKTELVFEDVQEFRSFFKQLSFRINSHKNYEADLSGAKVRNDSLLLRFNLEEYLSEIHQYFLENGLYIHLSEHAFHQIVLSILVPESAASEYLDAAVSKELFTGVLMNVARESNVRISHLVKFYYEYIKNLEKGFAGKNSDELLEVYKAAIALIPAEEVRSANSAGDPLQNIGVLMDCTESFNIRTRADLKHLNDHMSLPGYLIRLAVFIAPTTDFLENVTAELQAIHLAFCKRNRP
jgi:hypothetical protein